MPDDEFKKWEAEKLEPLRAQVAMLVKEMQMMLLPDPAEGVTAAGICKAISARAETVLANTQATAEAYIAEHDAKLLENVAKHCGKYGDKLTREHNAPTESMIAHDLRVDFERQAEQLRATAKKGEVK